MSSPPPSRVAVAPPGLSADFYHHCARGELRFQRCGDCGRWRHPPRMLCPGCRSEVWQWGLSSGSGRLYTWTVVHQAVDPALRDDVPYALVVVELDEGPRLVARARHLGLHQLRIGLAMTVGFDVVSEEMALPWFEPADH